MYVNEFTREKKKGKVKLWYSCFICMSVCSFKTWGINYNHCEKLPSRKSDFD